jgi:2-iminobutanoate/2-iminopropanoate deaminase
MKISATALLVRSACVAITGSVLLVGCTPAAQPAASPVIEFLTSPSAALKALPFSEAVRVGDFLFLSGQIGTAPDTAAIVPGGIAAEAKQTMENIKATLERHGASMDKVVKCTVFLADMKEWPAFNEVYRPFFPAHFPARSALGANGLALGARVEVECIAFAPRR